MKTEAQAARSESGEEKHRKICNIKLLADIPTFPVGGSARGITTSPRKLRPLTARAALLPCGPAAPVPLAYPAACEDPPDSEHKPTVLRESERYYDHDMG